MGESGDEWRACHPWFSEVQLRSALFYYRVYPEEIDRRLAKEAWWDDQKLDEVFLDIETPKNSR